MTVLRVLIEMNSPQPSALRHAGKSARFKLKSNLKCMIKVYTVRKTVSNSTPP